MCVGPPGQQALPTTEEARGNCSSYALSEIRNHVPAREVLSVDPYGSSDRRGVREMCQLKRHQFSQRKAHTRRLGGECAGPLSTMQPGAISTTSRRNSNFAASRPNTKTRSAICSQPDVINTQQWCKEIIVRTQPATVVGCRQEANGVRHSVAHAGRADARGTNFLPGRGISCAATSKRQQTSRCRPFHGEIFGAARGRLARLDRRTKTSPQGKTNKCLFFAARAARGAGPARRIPRKIRRYQTPRPRAHFPAALAFQRQLV